MDNNQQIEILLATYNGEKYLEEQIESIIQQSHKNWVLKIRDDGSNDSTLSIIEKYAREYPKQVHHIITESKEHGAKNNFWELLKVSDGKYIMCCDQDDVWYKDKIKTTLGVFLQSQGDKPRLVYTDLNVVDENIATISESFQIFSGIDCRRNSLNYLLCENVVTGCTMMFNDRLRDKALELEVIEHMKMHDYWIAMVASTMGEMEFIDKPTIAYRQHGGNVVGARSTASILHPKYILKALRGAEVNNVKYIEQAEIFYNCYEKSLHERDKKVLKAFIDMKDKNKCSKICTIIKYSIYKKNIIKRVGLLVTI